MRIPRTLRRAALLAGPALLVAPQAALACRSCFGAAANTPTTQGISMAMLSLIVLIVLIACGIVWFFNNIRRRARLLEPGNYTVTHLGEIRPIDGAQPT